jgi:ADP-heptose:LPS heptosyltransferase
MNAEHVVVVNFTRMGDLVQSGPFLRALKASHPAARLTTVVFNAFADVARRLPMVDDVVVFDVDRWVPLLDARRGDLQSAFADATEFLGDARLTDVDVLYNLAHTPQSATLCALMRPRQAHGRIGLDDGQMIVRGEWFNYLFSIMDERTFNPFNLVEIYLRVGSGRRAAHALELRVSDEDRREAARLLLEAGIRPDARYVVLQPGASSRSRQWPPAYFAQLASLLHMRGLAVVVVGSRDEEPLAENIVCLSRQHAVSLAGKTDVGTLAAVLEGAHRLVSNDTGTIHLAAAVGTPAVGVYLGPAAAKDTAPYGNGHVVIEADLPCAPCGYRDTCQTFSCHRRVTVDAVFRLCMASAQSLDETARTLTGMRVYRTQVDDRGEFSLRALNDPVAGPDFALLDFYRVFWDNLLNARPARGDRLNAPRAETRPAWRQGVESLRTILESAERWLFALLEEARKPAADVRRLLSLMRVKITVQNDLRRHAENFPQLAPVSRYLIVRLVSVRTGALREHLDDLSGLLETFENAVALLTAASSVSIGERREHVATA